ncbi:unnamed protein product [Linum trigynum]|uniref:Gnk2-homologous domain-containing protein n=1 Tax=Linum trigynum TaxID=586398 RepID=A0AAV2G2Y7_9ROSI
MAMPVFGLLAVVSLSIFLPLVAVADFAVNCDAGSGRRLVAATVSALVEDLKDKVPDQPDWQYCNVLTSSRGLQAFGYGSCNTGMITSPANACRNCLSTAGDALMRRCIKSTGGAGEVKGPTYYCYLKIGTSSCASMIH